MGNQRLGQEGRVRRFSFQNMRAWGLHSLFPLILCFSASGQDYHIGVPFITSFTARDFKVSNQNWDLAQDSRGVMYFANDYGILEYDGGNWNIIQVPPNRSNTLSMAFGDHNRLYVGAQDFFGYLGYDRRLPEQMSLINLSDSIPGNPKDIGNIWRTFRVNDKIIFFSWNAVYIKDHHAIKMIRDVHPFKMAFQADDRIFIQGNTDLFELRNDSLIRLDNGDFFRNQNIAFILKYSGNRLLIAGTSGNMFLYDFKSVKPFLPSDKEIFLKSRLECGILLRNGMFLAGTSDNGLILFNSQGRILQHITKKNGLGHNRIRKILEDKAGNWWILNEKGIDIVEASAPFFRIIVDPENSYPVYTSFVFNGALYVGNHAGLYVARWSNFFDYTKYPVEFNRVTGTGDICWKLDTLANMLLLSTGNGLFQINGTGCSLLYNEYGTWMVIRSVKRADHVFAGTYNGIILFDLNRNGLKYRKKLAGFDETSRVVEEDNEGNLWVAHGYKGIYKLTLNAAQDSILSVEFYDHRKGFPTDLFINMFRIRNNIVFGTQFGPYKYDESRDSMVLDPYYASVLGHSEHVRYLHMDYQNKLLYVLGAYTGLAVPSANESFSPEKTPFQKLTHDYIPGFENFFFFDNGNALIGTVNGLVLYDHQLPVQSKSDFTALLNRVSFLPGDEMIYDGRLAFYGDSSMQQRVRIPFIHHNLRFDFSSCFYENIDLNQFSYYLEGFDEKWSDWSAVRFKEFTNLPEGKYAFHLKARNVYYEESNEIVFRFSILPPWYRTTLAYVFYILTLFFSFWLLIRRRSYRFEKEKKHIIREQEKLREYENTKYHEEKLKTELEHKNKELEASAIKILYKNEKISEIKKLIENFESGHSENQPKKLALIKQFIDKELNDDQWDEFELLFDQTHNHFIQRLKEAFPDLSSRDLKVCVYLRMNLSTKEIAQMLNMTVRGVETARFRIRQRMGLESSENLNSFILRF